MVSKPPLHSDNWSTYRRLLRYMRPYLGRLILGILFGLLYAAMNGALLWTIKEGLGKIYDPHASLLIILLYAALFPIVGLLRGVGDYLSKYLIRWVGSRVVMDLRNAIFARLNALSLSYFVSSHTGELISRTANDTGLVESAVSTVAEDLAKEPVTLLIMIGVLYWLDPLLATASLFLFPICIIPVILFGRRVRRFTREAQGHIADVMTILQEMIMGVRIVKAFGMEQYEMDRFGKQNKAFFSRTMRVARASSAIEPVIVFISTLGVAFVLVYIHNRNLAFNQFVTYAGALVMMYTPVKKLSRLHLQIQQASAAADRIFELLDQPVDVTDRSDAVPLRGPIDRIAFDGVHFAYGDKAVLSAISFEVCAGQRIAFVGSSGAGKTTLVNLLPRFYDVQRGAVRFNGRDIREFTLATLRRNMGIVTQETILFNDTVATNISYGTVGATREEIVRAAQRAHAHEFILAMPEGYDTVVGEAGMRLSGGQRQRLAIARAILRNPPIMILDEATSALDTESERQVQAALHDLMEGRTVFAIAHRLSTIAHCDRILVLDGGRIVEDGTHVELLRRSGIYKYLYDLQFQEAGEVSAS